MTPTDLELVNNIKTHCNVRYSLEELVNRHSGIYFEVINRMVPVSSTYCNRQELFEDRNFNIYTAALKYDETMGAKFSTLKTRGTMTKFRGTKLVRIVPIVPNKKTWERSGGLHKMLSEIMQI